MGEGRAFRQSMASGNAGVGASSSGASSSRSQGKVADKLNLEKANRYKPPETTLFHSPTEYRIWCFIGPTRIGRGCNLSVGMDTAIRVTLKLAWEVWLKLHSTDTYAPGILVSFRWHEH